MPSHADNSKVFQRLADQTSGQTLNVFGPTVEFLTWSDEFCVLRGVVPPGVTVPLHRHADTEDFFIISGTQQVLATARTVWNGEMRTPATMCAYRVTSHTPSATSPMSRQSPSSSRPREWVGSFRRSVDRSPVHLRRRPRQSLRISSTWP